MTSSEIIGTSKAIESLRKNIARVARTSARVLILGEPGTGKELVARAIHAQSGLSGSLITVNCGAIPESLVEAELFGVAKGAFTGATSDRAGLFERAHGGTLFLDEVGELPLAAQVKLLRVLQEGEVERVGAGRAVRVNVRVLSATNVDLRAAITSKRFRPDLFDRLNVFPLRTTPLRERLEDLEDLLKALAKRRGWSVEFQPAALARLARHDWPGNVRELVNIVERLHVLADKPQVSLGLVEEVFALDSAPGLPEPQQKRSEGLEDIFLRIEGLVRAVMVSGAETPSEHREIVLAAPAVEVEAEAQTKEDESSFVRNFRR